MELNSLRLDVALVESKLADSRQIAKKLIENSLVKVDGKIQNKASFKVLNTSDIVVLDNDLTQYVSRGALKLEAALDCFQIDVSGFTAVDFGASTGGFTDLLLQRGAERVYAIENGVGQLHQKLRSDDRVISLENTNARYLEKGFIPPSDIAVMDVSFISQTKLYNSVLNLLKDGGYFVSLIKPQFEAGKSALNKKGVVKDPTDIERAVNFVKQQAEISGFNLVGIVESPILGGDGNKEFLAFFIKR